MTARSAMCGFIPASTDETTLAISVTDGPFPGQLWTWAKRALALPGGRTYMGFIQRGEATLSCEVGVFTLRAGMYWCAPFGFELTGEGAGVVFGCPDGFVGMFQLGGPVEATGRLRYIDGCSDSLLIHPNRLGEPCLNLLHLPAGTLQSEHTHPSLRFGVIVSGQGYCVTPQGSVELEPGLAFCIPAHAPHSFHTPRDKALQVIAYHPDSDYGPQDEDHPMLNRTFLTSKEPA